MLTCGPFVLTLSAWTKLTFLYYQFRPSPSWLPPWQDPQILTLSLLCLLAPIGMILGVVAGVSGAPKWLICIVEIASVPLLVVGLMPGAAV
jgi:hypothetical protein